MGCSQLWSHCCVRMYSWPLWFVLLCSHRQRALLSWCPFYQCWTVLLTISHGLSLKVYPLFLFLSAPKRISLQLLLLILLMDEFSRFFMPNYWLYRSIHNVIYHICLPWRSASLLATHNHSTFGRPLLGVFVNSSFNSRGMLCLLVVWVFLVAISLSFDLRILVRIKHIDSFLIVEMVDFLQNDLSSYWSDLIINSLRIQFPFNLGFVVSLLLKDRLVDVVIIIHFVIGLMLALDWAGMRTSVEATTGLTVDCGRCQGSKLVITSSRFFACSSLI